MSSKKRTNSKTSIPLQKTNLPPRIKSRLTNEQFVERFLQLYECRSEMAQEMGVSYQAVNQRAKKLQPLIEKTKARSAVAVVLDHQPDTQGGEFGGFVGRYLVFNNIESLYADVSDTIAMMKGEIAEIKRRRAAGDNSQDAQIKPWHVQSLVQLVNQGRLLLMDCHKVRSDLFNAKGSIEYIQATAAILMEEIPDVRRRLFIKLMEMGIESDVTTIFSDVNNPASDITS